MIHHWIGRKEMIECDGYIPGEINGCLQYVDEWWAERGMNLCHNCGCEERHHWEDQINSLEMEGYYA